MDLSKYDGEIRGLIERMLAARSRNDPAVLRLAGKVVRYATERGDHALLGFGSYYLAEACFLFGRYDRYRRSLVSGMKYQQALSQDDLLARSYNLLAIDAMNHGSTDLGLGYFLQALKESNRCGDRYQSGVIRMNIGMVYMRLRMEQRALAELRQAVSLLKSCPEGAFCAYNLLTAFCAQGECCLRLGRADGAAGAMARAEKMLASGRIRPGDNVTLVPFRCFQAKLFHSRGDFAARDESVEQLLDSLERTKIMTDIFDDVCDLCSFLLEIGRPAQARRVIERIRPAIEKAGVPNLRFRLAGLCVRYCRISGDAAQLRETEAEYYDLSAQMESERIRVFQHAAQIQAGMAELQEKQLEILEENVRLTRQAQSDPVTGLPNRYALNTYSESAFEWAYRHQMPLCVCILDIDHFKGYNDSSGHQAGDECLSRVAAEIRRVCSENGGFCARYGGDEFVILYEGLSDDEVTALAERLRDAVLGLGIPHAASSVGPCVTVSQGMRNSVPTSDNRLWDFLYAADNALYRVKKTQKGGILLIHNARISPTAFTE